MQSGINNFMGMESQYNNPVMFTKGIVEGYVFIDVAKVTKVIANRLTCTASGREYTNVEVLILGVNGYGVKLVPAVGDRVLILAPCTPMESVELYNPTNTMNNYDRSGIKAIPLTDSKTSQLLTVDRSGVKLTGDNKFTLNSSGITVEDKNKNKVEMTSSGISVEDKNKNKIKTTSSGIAVEDKNSVKITTSSSGIVLQGKKGKVEIK